MKLSVLVPVYNEENTLVQIISKVLRHKVIGVDSVEIIIVDDHSTDNSAELMKQLRNEYPEQIQLHFQKKNQGKGAAIRKAIEFASGDIAIIQDADLEYDPHDYSSILPLLISGKADVVFGSRFILRDERRAFYFKHAMGNKLITFFTNLTTDLYLTDVETCYKAFQLDLLQSIPLHSNRFGIEIELAVKIAKRKFTVFEVPINYYARSHAEGKKITWKDCIVVLWTIIKYWIINDNIKKNHEHGK